MNLKCKVVIFFWATLTIIFSFFFIKKIFYSVVFGNLQFNTKYVSIKSYDNFRKVNLGDSIESVHLKIGVPFKKEKIKYLSIYYFAHPTIPKKFRYRKKNLYYWPLVLSFDENGKILEYIDVTKSIDNLYIENIKEKSKEEIINSLGGKYYLKTLHDHTILYYSKKKEGFVTGKYGDYYIKNVILNKNNKVIHIVDSGSEMGDYNSVIKNMGFY